MSLIITLFMHSLADFSRQFDTYNTTTQDLVKKYCEPFVGCNDYDSLVQNLYKYCIAGKRIRPYLVWLFSPYYETDTIPQESYAMELFHAMALAHDDIIDNSSTRRNTPTPHCVFSSVPHKGDDVYRDVQGKNYSILFGDFLLAESFMYLTTVSTRSLFHEMIRSTVMGQVYDVQLAHMPHALTLDDIKRVHYLKTSLYTFIYPSRIGYALSDEQDPVIHELLNELGSSLGTLFQMRDDVYDCSVTVPTGKSYFNDAQAGLPTSVTSWASVHDPVLYNLLATPHSYEQRYDYARTIAWDTVFHDMIQEEKRILESIQERLFTQEFFCKREQAIMSLCNKVTKLF